MFLPIPSAWESRTQATRTTILLESHYLWRSTIQLETCFESDWGTYDALGNLKKIESYLQGSSDLINAFSYDPYGNLTEEVDPVGYTIDYTFDSTVHSHIVQIKDSFGYVSTAKYDLRFGLPTSSTDINGNTTNRFYDDFGRLVQVFGPYDQTMPALQFAYYQNELPARAVTKNKIHFDP